MSSNSINQPVSQQALDSILASLSLGTKLSTQLQAAGYSTILSNLKFDVKQNKHIDFSDCQFQNVTFTGNLQHSVFEHTSFINTLFDNANLAHSIFNDASFEKSTITHSDLSSVTFFDSQFNNHKVYNCNFSNASFAQMEINKAIFAKSYFNNALDYENIKSDLHFVYNQQTNNDYVFTDAKGHLIQPTVAVVSDADWYSTPHYIIGEYGGTPYTVNEYNSAFNDTALKYEVQNVINQIDWLGLTDNSIAQQVINSDQPTINAIKKYAYEVMSEADALWIPGGPDLHPEFYGEASTDAYPSMSYYREILEFSLAQAAISMDKPILGVCHGSQLMNVYLGGTLHQHVDTPSGHVNLKTHTNKGLLGSIMDNNSIGPSYHHQAVKDLAPTLEVVASHGKVIKATQATDGKKIMLTQFHPEHEADESSLRILNKFLDLSADQKSKTAVLKLSDVIDNHHEIPVDTTQPAITANGCGNSCSPYVAPHPSIFEHFFEMVY